MENKKRSWAYLVYRLVRLLRPYWADGPAAGRVVAWAALETGDIIHAYDDRTNGAAKSIKADWLSGLQSGFNDTITPVIDSLREPGI